MFIKLTNATQGYLDSPLYFNVDWIVTYYTQSTDGGSLTTLLYGGPTGIHWYVEESPEQITKLINDARSKSCSCK
jgi:hypothetical protein